MLVWAENTRNKIGKIPLGRPKRRQEVIFKHSCNVSWRPGDRMFGFHPYFDIRLNKDGTVVSSTSRPHFPPPPPRKISLYSFLLKPELTPGLRHFTISKDATGNRTRDLPSCGVVLNHLHHRSPNRYDDNIKTDHKDRGCGGLD
jgi:hypothetical protein